MAGETTLRSPDESLQTLIDRYSLVGEDSDLNALVMANAQARYAGELGARQGNLYGELIKGALVHIWADKDKNRHAHAHVLQITNSFVTVTSHIYDRSPDAEIQYNWTDNTGISYSVPLETSGDSLKLVTHREVVYGKFGIDLEYAEQRYSRVAKALAHFAGSKRVNDALHQSVARRDLDVSEAEVLNNPYAGDPTGPRVNLEEMIRAGVPVGEAVKDALTMVPPLYKSGD